jgi:hypothetical protein
MTADSTAGRLARRIAVALIALLPTSDWTSDLAGDIAYILSGGDRAQITAVDGQLRASRDQLLDALPEQRDRLEADLYEQWVKRLELILAADPDSIGLADEALAELHQAGSGFGSRGVQYRGLGSVRGHGPGSAQGAAPDAAPPAQDGSGARYLQGRCPEVVAVGRPFSLTARVVQSAAGGGAPLPPFDGPADILLVLHAPGLRLLGDHRLTVRVPAVGNSSPVMFELQADAEGPRSVSITAWLGGSYLGELIVAVTAERGRVSGPSRDSQAEIGTEASEGAVSLVVRHDPALNAYRFEFRDEDYPNEVVSRLSFDPRHRVERLVGDLDKLAEGRSGYSAEQTRDYLANAGAELWRELVPPGLRDQFWERQHRIRQLTILSDNDTVPWELLYPRDRGHDEGFLVQQFPVTRAVFGRRPAAKIGLRPPRFVLPADSLPEAEVEVDAMRRLLDPARAPQAVISELTPLLDAIRAGDFGLLHFACHNKFRADDDASIELGGVEFTPRFMTNAAIDQTLGRSAPTIFMNACRSAGLAPTYNRLSGWASMFLEAGAGAFIGSLWSVSDGTAREFAEEFYAELLTGASLGVAMMKARAKAAAQADDPTWLAYSAYGDPRATVTRPR